VDALTTTPRGLVECNALRAELNLTVYSQVENRTQTRQLQDECAACAACAPSNITHRQGLIQAMNPTLMAVHDEVHAANLCLKVISTSPVACPFTNFIPGGLKTEKGDVTETK